MARCASRRPRPSRRRPLRPRGCCPARCRTCRPCFRPRRSPSVRCARRSSPSRPSRRTDGLPSTSRAGPRIGIAVENRLDDGRRRHAGAEQRERLRSVADVDDGLRRGDADVRFGPQHAVADREDARLYRAADFAGVGVVAENRERGDWRKRKVSARLGARGTTASAQPAISATGRAIVFSAMASASKSTGCASGRCR